MVSFLLWDVSFVFSSWNFFSDCNTIFVYLEFFLWEHKSFLSIDSIGVLCQPAIYTNIVSLNFLFLHWTIVASFGETEIIVGYSLSWRLLLLLLLLLGQMEMVWVQTHSRFAVGAVSAIQVAVGWDQIWSQTFLKKKINNWHLNNWHLNNRHFWITDIPG